MTTIFPDLSERLRALSDPLEIQHECCKLLADKLEADRACNVEIDQGAGIARVDRDFVRNGASSIVGLHPLDRFNWSIEILARGDCLIISNTRTSARIPERDRDASLALGIAAILAVPHIKGGQLVGAVCVTSTTPRDWTQQDVTVLGDVAHLIWSSIERARAEAALAESQTPFSALVNTTSFVTFRMSPDWTTMTTLEGRGDIKHTTFPMSAWLEKYIDAADQDLVMARIRQSVRTGEVFELEHRVKRDDRRLGWSLTRAIPIRNVSGEIVEWFGAASDITEHRLTIDALMNSQRYEAAGRLAGAAAHEFNNLLMVVTANIELAELTTADASRRKHLENAMRAVTRGQDLTERLQSFARRKVSDPRIIRLNEHLAEWAAIIDRIMGEQIDVTLNLSDNLWPVRVDVSDIDTALLNAAVNARDAMPRGGEIRIFTSNVSVNADQAKDLPGATPGAYVCIALADTGEGMDEEVRRRASEPFFSTRQGGAGLGLYTATSILSQMGGFHQILSKVGHGTTFRLFVPRADQSLSMVQSVAVGHETRAMQEEKITVLLVEDHDEVRKVIRGQLKVLGYDVLEARDASEAYVQLSGGDEIGMVLCDIVLPGGISGRDIIRHVQSNHPSMGVLLMTGYSPDHLAATPGTAPIPVLLKPYRMDELRTALKAAIDDRSRSDGM